ncbi:PKD domain-containing protein [Nocardioides sp. CPCC 206347]|uniref:PKD domain-containing protein n=1 Tax=Nocardioides sp. CPCC 206347 TaxID=3406463 RepID=UPI003B43D175
MNDGSVLPFGFCLPPDSGPEVLTVSIVRTAFAELKLPAAKLVIQPPDGLTLVNFDTNFYTTSTRPISRTVTLLGQQVTLEATPAEFHWIFGDGQSLATSEPGAPYPDLTITHNYLRTGTYQPSLDTVFTGRFRVGGGPWRQIPGTVTINGAGQALRAIEAQPKLVGY